MSRKKQRKLERIDLAEVMQVDKVFAGCIGRGRAKTLAEVAVDTYGPVRGSEKSAQERVRRVIYKLRGFATAPCPIVSIGNKWFIPEDEGEYLQVLVARLKDMSTRTVSIDAMQAARERQCDEPEMRRGRLSTAFNAIGKLRKQASALLQDLMTEEKAA